ncbi:BatA domain-containing protein [candidate division WOR-3 bacterium]|nr:BatA domain-containing protein [candidate division WOR-3 bacterium]
MPVIIHLISRKKLKKIDFPSLLFIVKSDARLIRWFRLKRIFLLIMRIGLIIALILAAANLKIPFDFVTPSEILIVDKSPSMDRIEIKNENAFIIPNKSGIPQFLQYLKRHPVGILITDAQRNGFIEILKEREKFPGISIKKMDFPKGNLGIIGASSTPSFEDEKFVLNFKILNEYKDKKKTSIILETEGKILKKESSILNVGENILSFELYLRKGLYQLSLELEDEEGFIFDNKFYFVVNVRERKNICILSDAYPERLISALSTFYFEVKWVKEIADVKGDFFFVYNTNEKDELDLLQIDIPGIFCLQGETNTSVSNKIPDRISTIADGSPFNNSLYLKNLSEIPVRYSCIITEGKTLMYFENGDPFVNKIENHLLFPISLEKNDLSLHPVFIPFLFGLIDFLSEGESGRNILLEDPLEIKSSTEPQIISPKGEKYKPHRIDEDNYIFKETKECGVYKITDGKKIIGLAAVNTHPSESKLDSLSEEEVGYIFGGEGFVNGAVFFLFIALLFFVLSLFMERKM